VHLHKIGQKQAEPGWIFDLQNKLFHAVHENLRFVIKNEVEIYPLLAHDVKGLEVQFAAIKFPSIIIFTELQSSHLSS
jgi:hypothetical protein